jgi:glyoxylase-like metal-dependent hydrolase (beta-lactamase superfamily II)
VSADGSGGESDGSVERIAHAAASPEGENSTYVLPDRGLVIDPGPPGDEPWATLTAGLHEAGLSVRAVETVFVTHWHADHAGLAPRLAAAADATLAVGAADAPLVGDYAAERSRRVDRDARRLREWGVPDPIVEAVRAGDDPSPMPDACPVRAVADGASVSGGTVVATPGHTAGHAALAFDDPRVLFVGDAVLPQYTPNVGGSDTRLDAPLATYLDTLERLRAVGEGPSTAFPGHGATVALPARVATIRAHHADRVRAVVDTLPHANGASRASRDGDADPDGRATEGPARTPWTVAGELFGEMRGIHAKMGAGEAAAHLRHAADRGLADRVADAPVRYVATVSGVRDLPDAVVLTGPDANPGTDSDSP